jgi:hypothetical protein
LVVIWSNTRRDGRRAGLVQAHGVPALLSLAPVGAGRAGVYVMPSVLVAGLSAAGLAHLALVRSARGHALPAPH